MQDITKLKLVEDELRRLNEELEDIVDEQTKELKKEIGERRRAEEDLLKFKLGFERSGEIIFMTDTQGRIVYVNPAFEDVYGYTAKEAIGQTPRILKSGEHPEEVYKEFWDKILSKESVEHEFINKTKDGRLINIEANANPILDSGGNIIGFLAIQRDITVRKRTEMELERELDTNQAFAKMSAAMITSPSMEDVAEIVLESAKQLTESEHGYVGSIDPRSRDLITHTLTKMMGKDCKITGLDEKMKFPVGGDGKYPGLWGHSLNTRKPFYENAPAKHEKSRGVPKGHVPLENYLSVPAVINGNLVGQICLANSKRAYADDDLETIARLGDLYAIAIQRMRDEARIRDSLKEKEVLLQEIHHRVKNNLQVISSLLYLQSRSARDKEAIAMLNDSQSRVKTMSLIHEKLYKSEDLAHIDFGEYLTELIDVLVKSYKTDTGKIKIEKDIQKVPLGIDSAIPCGLMLNELISNSLKYAFPGGRSGQITVRVHQRTNGEVEIVVSDDGIGLPEDVNPAGAKTLGLKLIRRFTEKLKGTLEINRDSGTEFRIRFLNRQA